MPNLLAYAMLAAWPFITWMMFRRLPVEKALIWALVSGYLLLPPAPASFDFPLLPPFNKDSIPSLSVFFCCFFLYGHRGSIIPENGIARLLLAVFIFSPAFTVLTNGEAVFYGQVGIRGLGVRDMLALCMLQFITVIPFLLARRLWVALFAVMVLTSALAIARAETGRTKLLAYCAGAYMAVVLVLCKSMGSMIFAAFLIPMVLFFSNAMQIRVAGLVALLAIGYPLLKGLDLIPMDAMLEQVSAISEERAGSLRFRFVNEDILRERAMLKPLFGWGSWGRNHILHPVSGILLTVTDGRWIIVIGVYGWFGRDAGVRRSAPRRAQGPNTRHEHIPLAHGDPVDDPPSTRSCYC